MRASLLKMACVVWLVLFPGVARAEDADVIEYRQHLMKGLEAQFEAVMLILTARAPEAHILGHMEALEETASLVLKVFETKVPGGKALPKVWDDWSAFSATMKEFDERLKTAVAMTRTQGAAGALQGLEFVSCQKCHDVYRKQP